KGGVNPTAKEGTDRYGERYGNRETRRVLPRISARRRQPAPPGDRAVHACCALAAGLFGQRRGAAAEAGPRCVDATQLLRSLPAGQSLTGRSGDFRIPDRSLLS